ncbi:MAG TPA: M1 family aminopeptidase [Pyrinomonadaceae bacterium]|nr:M1 family aminopeptidase [Pyrinomonadaceae bacterium]
MLKNLRVFALLLCLLTFSVPASTQAQRQNFNRERTYDVQHYILRVSFDRKNKIVFGDTTVLLKPLQNNFKTLELDAAGLKFESVRLEAENKDLNYRQANSKIIISLDQSYQEGKQIAVRFKYSAKPLKGVYFVDAVVEKGKTIRPAQVWTQGEPDEAHHWFPSYDFPDDKATSEQFITVEGNETAIGNGELIKKTKNRDGTLTFHYKMPVPHSTYLTSFVVGNYVRISDNYKNIPLGYYVYPGSENVVPVAYGTTKDIFRIFEELTGIDYPYNKYDQTIVANFQFGGMENITATTMADTEIFFSKINKSAVEDLVSHEIAHSWFGNLVTCKNWAELWLNEGFATFMEAAYREKMYGRKEYMRKIRDDAFEFIISEAVIQRPHGLFNLTARDVNKLFETPAITYDKGGAVIHTLRETVGDDAFWKAVNDYLERHKFGNVETTDLQRVMEEASGKNLDWFFKQWVYGTGFPKLEVKQVYNPTDKKLSLTVSQTQKSKDLTPAVFQLPLEIEIQTSKGTKREKLHIKKRAQTFTVALNEEPKEILFDKDSKIPIMTVKQLPLIKADGRKAR